MHYFARGAALAVLAAGLVFVSQAGAQQSDTNVGIGWATAGGLFGQGAHGSYGVGIGDAVSKHIVPFLDFSYSPLISYGYTYGANETGKGLFTSSVLDFNGGIKIRLPGKGDWVPYFGLGGGLLRFATSNYESGFGTTATLNNNRNELAGNASVGGLYYVTPHVGVDLELKGYAGRYDHILRASAGIFFQFP
jgi:hypothetical protein